MIDVKHLWALEPLALGSFSFLLFDSAISFNFYSISYINILVLTNLIYRYLVFSTWKKDLFMYEIIHHSQPIESKVLDRVSTYFT